MRRRLWKVWWTHIGGGEGEEEYEECWEQLNLQNANQPVRSNFPFLSYSSCFLYSSVIVVIIIICYCYSNHRITLLMEIRPTLYHVCTSQFNEKSHAVPPTTSQAKPSQAPAAVNLTLKAESLHSHHKSTFTRRCGGRRRRLRGGGASHTNNR